MTPEPPGRTCEQIFAPFRLDHARMLSRIDELEAVVRARRDGLDEALLRELIAEIDRKFATHMAAEEDVLFPAMAQAIPEVRGTLVPLRADHDELRVLLGELSATLMMEDRPARDERVGVIARDFVDLIRLHIRKEEMVVFQVACRVLTDADVGALGRRLDAMEG